MKCITVFGLVMVAAVALPATGGEPLTVSNPDLSWPELSVEVWREATPEAVEAELRAGAEVDARGGDYASTALMLAAEMNENPDVVHALLDAGADLEARDESGGTALMRAAARNENPEIIEALLDAGADLEARDEHGRTALMLVAALNENPEIIKTLVDAGANVKAAPIWSGPRLCLRRDSTTPPMSSKLSWMLGQIRMWKAITEKRRGI